MRRVLTPLILLLTLVAPALSLASAPAGAVTDVGARSSTAVEPAAVRSTLKQTQGGLLKGRLVSPRQDCVQARDVYLVVREDGSPYPDIVYIATTNGQGRWTYPETKRRGGTLRIAALTLGGPKCVIAQSNQITYTGPRSGGGQRLAEVSITLQGRGQVENGRGEIRSSRGVCHEYRPVFGFLRPVGTHDPFIVEIISISRRNGGYQVGENGSMRRLGGSNYDVIAVVPGTNNCRPAQSKPKVFDLG